MRPLMLGPTPGPGRVVTAWLVHSIPTREPNLEPLSETMCLRIWDATISRCWLVALFRIH